MKYPMMISTYQVLTLSVRIPQEYLYEHGTPVCVLTIPNQLLLDWNDSNTTTFVSKANDSIINEIVTLRQEKHLENALASPARTIKSRAKKMRSGS